MEPNLVTCPVCGSAVTYSRPFAVDGDLFLGDFEHRCGDCEACWWLDGGGQPTPLYESSGASAPRDAAGRGVAATTAAPQPSAPLSLARPAGADGESRREATPPARLTPTSPPIT